MVKTNKFKKKIVTRFVNNFYLKCLFSLFFIKIIIFGIYQPNHFKKKNDLRIFLK